MSKRLKWIIGILVLLIVVLVVLKATGTIGKDEGTKITTEKAVRRTITETVSASGKVYPEVEVKISPDISGQIVELNVAEGDTVKKGQVLARIYADLYTSQRDQAAAVVAQSQAQVANSEAQMGALKASLDQTEAAYKRNKQLVEDKVISQAEFETAQQAYLSAKANYAAAQKGVLASQANVDANIASLNRASKDVGRTTISAPMDGVISLLSVKNGERVAGNNFNVGTEMMRIADLNSIEVQVEVSENDIPKVKLNDSADVEVDAYNQRKFKGIVYKIANPTPSLTSSAGSTTTVTNYEVHIRLLPESYADLMGKGKPFPFRPNMTGSADIKTHTEDNVLSVPLNAVTTRDKNNNSTQKTDNNNNSNNNSNDNTTVNSEDINEVVFVVQKDGTVKQHNVKTGIQDLNNIQVLTGINAGDEVVTGPYDVVSKDLKDGAKVKIVSKDQLVQGAKK
jgi:HlyD family secretion protein